MNKYLVYTAIFNNYDWLKEPVVVPNGVDFVCYTDSPSLSSKHWKVVKVDARGKSPSLLNREIKLLYPYTEMSDYNYSLYVDGSIMIKGNVLDFFQKYTEKEPVLMNFQHPNNDCIFEEIKRCLKLGRGNADKLLEQYVDYKNDKMPVHYGLSDNKILLRDNHSKEGNIMMKEWYEHVVNYSGRDQVCLSYVLFKHGMHYSFFDENIEKNEFFETWPHNTVIWYIRYWRHVKWFLERHHIMTDLIRFVDNWIKPRMLKT